MTSVCYLGALHAVPYKRRDKQLDLWLGRQEVEQQAIAHTQRVLLLHAIDAFKLGGPEENCNTAIETRGRHTRSARFQVHTCVMLIVGMLLQLPSLSWTKNISSSSSQYVNEIH